MKNHKIIIPRRLEMLVIQVIVYPLADDTDFIQLSFVEVFTYHLAMSIIDQLTGWISMKAIKASFTVALFFDLVLICPVARNMGSDCNAALLLCGSTIGSSRKNTVLSIWFAYLNSPLLLLTEQLLDLACLVTKIHTRLFDWDTWE